MIHYEDQKEIFIPISRESLQVRTYYITLHAITYIKHGVYSWHVTALLLKNIALISKLLKLMIKTKMK